MLVIRIGIHKMLVRIANREDPNTDCLDFFGRQLLLHAGYFFILSLAFGDFFRNKFVFSSGLDPDQDNQQPLNLKLAQGSQPRKQRTSNFTREILFIFLQLCNIIFFKYTLYLINIFPYFISLYIIKREIFWHLSHCQATMAWESLCRPDLGQNLDL